MLIFSRHSLHWSIESQARTWRRPKRYPGFHIPHNIDIVSCTCCMYIPVYFVLCTIYICFLRTKKIYLYTLHIYIPPNQITSTSTCISGYQFATNLSMRGVFKFASRNHSQVVKMTKSTFSRNLFWFVKVQNGKFLVSRTCIHPDWTNHRWVSPDMFSFRDKDFKCLLSPGWECGSFEVWRVSTHLVLGKLVDSMTSQNEVTKKSSNWDSISWIPWKKQRSYLTSMELPSSLQLCPLLVSWRLIHQVGGYRIKMPISSIMAFMWCLCDCRKLFSAQEIEL